jgi:hypothetical protein
MSARHPSLELVRFLTTHWPMSDTTIGEIQSQSSQLPEPYWDGFSRDQILADLIELVRARRPEDRVRDVAKPIVLCIFGHGGDGKSTFAHLVRQGNVNVFSTDKFVWKLTEDWHDSLQLRELAQLHVPSTVDQFIRKVESNEATGKEFVRLFFDPTHGFNFQTPLSAIEGYLRYIGNDAKVPAIRLELEIVSELKKRGYKVWVAKSASRAGLDQ